MASTRYTGVLVGLAIIGAAANVHAQVIRTLSPLGGNSSSTAQAINSTGLVVGYSTSTSSIDLPTLWRPGAGGAYTAEPLPLPAGAATGGANAISSTGIIVGYAQPSSGATASAVIWTPTGPGGTYTVTTLAAPAGMDFNAAFGVNAAGFAAGFGGSINGGSVAMAWAPTAVPLPPVISIDPQYEILAGGINDGGDIAGYGFGPSLPLTSWVWRPNGAGGYVRKTVLAAESAAVTGISQYGTGVGVYAGDQPMVMSLYEGDYYATDLPTPYGSSDGASINVNNYDGIVGYAKDPSSGASGPEAAFWLPTETFWDYINLDLWLNSASPVLGTRWQLSEATGINDQWLVVGNGTYSVGPPRNYAFVLDVSSMVPEPASLSGLAAFVMLTLPLRRRRA